MKDETAKVWGWWWEHWASLENKEQRTNCVWVEACPGLWSFLLWGPGRLRNKEGNFKERCGGGQRQARERQGAAGMEAEDLMLKQESSQQEAGQGQRLAPH